jgi:hypothetical protein
MVGGFGLVKIYFTFFYFVHSCTLDTSLILQPNGHFIFNARLYHISPICFDLLYKPSSGRRVESKWFCANNNKFSLKMIYITHRTFRTVVIDVQKHRCALVGIL